MSFTVNVRLSVTALLGFSVWFPAFAPIVFRNNGLQLAPMVAGLVLIVAATSPATVRFNKRLLVLTVLWFIFLVGSTLFSPHAEQAIRGGFLLLSGFVVMYSAYLCGGKDVGRRAFLSGFAIGGILSSLYAGYQLAAFRFGWPGGTLLNNNPSFPSYAQSLWLEELSRSFAFTPEPSVLSSLLIPLILVSLGKIILEKKRIRHSIVLAVLVLGLIASASVAIVLTLPLSVLCYLAANRLFRQKIVEHKKTLLSVCLAVLVFSALMYAWGGEWQLVQRTEVIVSYVLTGEELEPGSILVRFFSGLAAFQMFLERPFLGWGLFATDPEFGEKIPQWILIFEEKTGVDSWLLGIAMWQGLAGLVLFFILIYSALKKAKREWRIQGLLVGVIITIIFQTGYILLYHVWAILGLAFACGSANKISQADNLSEEV